MTQSSQNLQVEFIRKAGRLWVMRLPNIFCSRKRKRRTLCKFVDSLSKETFNLYALPILEMVNMKEDVCKEYANSKSQVDGVLEWLPRMKEQREILLAVIKEHRGRYGLNI